MILVFLPLLSFQVMPQIKEYQFFTGETMNPDGMVVLSLYEGESPVFYFFKDGLIEEKCVSHHGTIL